MNYSVDTTPCKKITITITRQQLWNNFIDCWKECVWDSPSDNFSLNDVKFVLLPNSINYNFMSVRNLFDEGLTVMLMGDAMEHIDFTKEDSLLEIVVVDGDNKIIVRHEDISF